MLTIEMLLKLKAGEFDCIEFGSPDDETKAGIRIRWSNTAGGPQFQIRMVNSLGNEHSSTYEHDVDAAINKAVQYESYYMKPHPNPKVRELLASRKGPPPKWYGKSEIPGSVEPLHHQQKWLERFQEMQNASIKVMPGSGKN